MSQSEKSLDEVRQDAELIAYPAKPDNKGSARVVWRRRSYYFGKFNSPESFSLFGEWKRRLVETGDAPEVKIVRHDLAHLPESSPSRPYRFLGWPVANLIAATVLGACVVGGAMIFSTKTTPMVDGVALTDEEIVRIRGMRSHQKRVATFNKEREDRVAELLARIREKGPSDGKRQDIRQRTGS